MGQVVDEEFVQPRLFGWGGGFYVLEVETGVLLHLARGSADGPELHVCGRCFGVRRVLAEDVVHRRGYLPASNRFEHLRRLQGFGDGNGLHSLRGPLCVSSDSVCRVPVGEGVMSAVSMSEVFPCFAYAVVAYVAGVVFGEVDASLCVRIFVSR